MGLTEEFAKTKASILSVPLVVYNEWLR